MKKFQVFLGLAVLVAALWAVGTPVDAEGKSLVGAWVVYHDCVCCESDEWNDCKNGEIIGGLDCAPGPFQILIFGTSLGGSPNELREACRGAGGEAGCFNLYHSECGNCTTN